jgi:hypothetical protein
MQPPTRRPTSPPLGRTRFAILAAVVLVLGHELVLRLGYGPAADASIALRATSHGLAWLLQALAALLATVGLAVVVLARLQRLRGRLASRAAAIPALSRPDRRELLILWERLFAVALIGFIVQENLEHALIHGHLPGLSMLYGGQYVATIPVFALLALAGAVIAGLARRRIEALEAAVRAADAALPRPAHRAQQPLPPRDLRTGTLLLIGSLSRRGPPPGLRS